MVSLEAELMTNHRESRSWNLL